MSFCKNEGDEQAIEEIISKCDKETKQHISKYYYKGNIKEALEELANSQIIVGGRFHANILGMLLKKAVIPRTIAAVINLPTTCHTVEVLFFDCT